MKTIVASILAALAATAFAAGPPAEAPAAAGTMPMQDCMKQQRHDHGSERGMPAPHANCPAAATADGSAPARKPKKARGHDHARAHKLM
jgi:hypothetical protein